MKTMITGVRPTGSITLANYIGGIKSFIEQQHKYNSLIFIADIHGLTTYIDPKEIRNNILDMTAMYLACGIDINNTIEKITMVLPQVMYATVGVVLIFFVVIVLVPMIQIYFGNFLFDMYL